MLDKLKLNNLIISNAKVIQKVRIQIIRKIIQKMRMLNKLLEKRLGDQSIMVKLRKCAAIVDLIKKIKREDIIRNILLLEKNPNKIVTNSRSKQEEVTIAMLAANKTMQDLVKRFRQELNYNDEEAESWKKTLIEVGKLKAKKQRRKKRAQQKEKKPKMKSKGAMLKKNSEHLEPIDTVKKKVNVNSSGDESTEMMTINLEVTNKQSAQKTKADELEKTTKDESKTSKNTKVSDMKETSEDDEEQLPKMAKAEALNKTTNDNKSTKTTKVRELEEIYEDDDDQPTNKNAKLLKKTTKHDDNHIKKKKVRNLEKTSEQLMKPAESQIKFLSGYKRFEVLPRNPKETTSNKSVTAVKVGVVDPFFITETGEPYIANIVLKPETSRDVDNTSKSQKDFAINPIKSRLGKIVTNQNPKFKPNIEDKQNRQGLHPSWVAKKKLNSITEFRGNKIIFDETDSSNKPVSQKNNKEGEKIDLHPSWAAKQKLKPTIAAFQGKKIIFGDEE